MQLTNKDKELIEQLAMKAVYSDIINNINEYSDRMENYIIETRNIDISGATFLANNPGIAAVVQKNYISREQRISEWENAEYSSSAGYPENLIFTTLKGHLVRSKAEMIISNQAFVEKIPYRYECDMILKNGCVTVDFVLKNPMNMVEIPMEHLGMLDISKYFDRTTEKLKKYISSGFFPSVNMILSYEFSDKPLDMAYVQKLFEQFWEISSVKCPWRPEFRYPEKHK